MQGIAALPTDMAPGGQGMGQLSAQEASTLGRLLTKVSQDEIDQLRELSQDLKEFSGPELSDFLGGVDYIMANAKNYQQSVRNLIARGIVEPGDLPAEYVPTFFAILRQMIVDTIGEISGKPQEFAKGGLVGMAKKVKAAGRHGDTMLAHITPREAAMLKAMGGAGTINPATGLPEFKSFWSKVGGFLKKAAPVILPIALNFVVPGLGAAVGGALGMSAAAGSAIVGAVGSGVGGLIAGQKPGQALLSAALGGIGSYASASLAPGGISGLLGGGGGEAAGGVMADGGGGADITAAAPGATASQAAQAAQAAGVAKPSVPIPLSRADVMGGGVGYSVSDAATAADAAYKGGSGISGGLGGIFDWAKANPLPAAALVGGAGLLLSGAGQKGEETPAMAQGPTGAQLLAQQPGQYGFNIANFQAQPMGPARMVQPQSPAFPGGYTGQLPGLYAPRYAKAGGHISGPGTGTSDDVPAMLSDGEFVMTAKAVRGAGDGDRMKGAKKMYKLMNSLEKRA